MAPFFFYLKPAKLNSIMLRIFLVIILLTGCSKPDHDPIEPINRGMYHINNATDYVIFKPLVWLYNGFIPPPVKTGIKNVAQNIGTIPAIFLDLVIWDLERFQNDSIKFAMNTSIGLGGLIDVAKMNGFTEQPINSADVLSLVDTGSSSYLFLPVLGPTTVHDLSGLVIDVMISPSRVLPQQVRTTQSGVIIVDAKANWFELEPIMLGSTPDPYATIRNGYLQRRAYQINSLRGIEKEDRYLTDQIPD